MYELNYKIRVICMEDFEHITNIDEYIGFLYGIISSDHDIETIFIDSILKHADVSLGDLPVFLKRLSGISEIYDLDFVVSVSAEKEEIIGVELSNYEVLNYESRQKQKLNKKAVGSPSFLTGMIYGAGNLARINIRT